ncbi:MAG TPA: thioredoxin domain-containing protein [Gemmatimonadaceae bacterium]|nr:thioredoxin domain-containing protein [Gemmatimonadaceae bacterium]
MPNRLASETSPYLLQHADNPVEWYPWGAEALTRARAEDRPILLSIGYAACHWCHVMEHESFEDPETASLMNELFVNIKVDREERPDLDGIYMQAVQAMTGHGGWPMTVFLTPEGAPFYGGTYFPPEDRHGIPAFRKVLSAVSDAYANKPDTIARTSEQLRSIYREIAPSAPEAGLSPHALELAFRSLAQQYDARHGGFGGAPKFPASMALDFILRHWKRTGAGYALEIALESFRHMARGGIYDQVGGGFARYSVDAVWLVPHFEKMLYDNALLTRLGVHLWRATRDAEVRRVTEETLRWVAREMTAPEGGFYSSLDADSEGHEGKFYVWTDAELDELLGEDAPVAKSWWGVRPGGNFEGKSILHVEGNPQLVAARHGTTPESVRDAVERAREVLYAARAKRVWPARDDKVLASWNGLMLRAAIEAAFTFGSDEWYELALRNADFIWREMVRSGRVWRVHRSGRTHTPGFLEDQAAVGLAFATVYSVTCELSWLQRAREITKCMVESFHDSAAGVFYDTAHDAEQLITRPREVTDNAIPAGSSLAAELLLVLAELDDNTDYRELANRLLAGVSGMMTRHPAAFGHMLGVADMTVRGSVQVALAGEPRTPEFTALEGVVAEEYVPALVLAGGDADAEGAPALLRGRAAGDAGARAYVCRGFTCDLPTSDPEILRQKLAAAASG